MACIKKQSIKEILYWLGIKDQTCTRKVMRFNRLLRMFYIDTYDFRQNIVAQKVVATWEKQTIVTENNINHVWWFFKPESLTVEWCNNCMRRFNAKSDDEKMIPMTESSFDSWKWIFSIEWQKEISATIPHTWDVYLIYSTWAPSINSICDTIEMDDFMLTWFEYLVEWFYQREQGNLNRQQWLSSEYQSWLEKSSKMQSNSIIYIWM